MLTSPALFDESAVAAHYDRLDQFYRSLWGEDLHHGLWISGRESPEQAVRQLTDVVLAAAQVGPGADVCDVGCGYGSMVRRVVDDFGARATGITNSTAQFDYARAANTGSGPHPSFVLSSWPQNELASRVFDAVLAVESLAYMPDKAAAFAECARVLRPGGRVVICDWYVAARPSSTQVRRLLEPICRDGQLPTICSRDDYEDLLGSAGLRVGRFVDLTAQVRRTWTVTMRRAAVRLARDQQARRFVRDRRRTGQADVLRLLRISVAMRTGALRYALVVAERPAASGAG